jgi:hypothetical protein
MRRAEGRMGAALFGVDQVMPGCCSSRDAAVTLLGNRNSGTRRRFLPRQTGGFEGPTAVGVYR